MKTPPITVWFSAQGHSVDGAFATKAEAYAATDWEDTAQSGDGVSFPTGNVFAIAFNGVVPADDSRAWIDTENNTVEIYSCMGTSILDLPKSVVERVKKQELGKPAVSAV